MSPQTHQKSAPLEGTTKELRNGNDSNAAANAAAQHLGDGERENNQDGGAAGDDTPVEITTIIERFKQNRRGLKERTREQYATRFRYFSKKVNLEQYTRQQLKGKKGRELILRYLDTIPDRSKRLTLAFIQPVWVYGLQIDWPIDMKRDLGKRIPKRLVLTPPDNTVREWATALDKETDIFKKLLIMLSLQFGWRPSHIARLKWGHILYDEQLKLPYLFADGAENDFKTFAPISAYIPEQTLSLFNSWKALHPNPTPESLIFPWRGIVREDGHYKMKVKSGQQISEEFITRQWKKFANKWHIPPLTPKDGRHWVATTTRKEGLSPQASALIMGHDLSNIGEGMRAAYDHPHIREWLQEQKLVLPKGCLGTLELQAQILVIPQDISFKIEQVITEYTTTSMPLRVATEKIGDILESYKNTILKERLLTV